MITKNKWLTLLTYYRKIKSSDVKDFEADNLQSPLIKIDEYMTIEEAVETVCNSRYTCPSYDEDYNITSW